MKQKAGSFFFIVFHALNQPKFNEKNLKYVISFKNSTYIFLFLMKKNGRLSLEMRVPMNNSLLIDSKVVVFKEKKKNRYNIGFK